VIFYHDGEKYPEGNRIEKWMIKSINMFLSLIEEVKHKYTENDYIIMKKWF
jgi:hypothetical protein